MNSKKRAKARTPELVRDLFLYFRETYGQDVVLSRVVRDRFVVTMLPITLPGAPAWATPVLILREDPETMTLSFAYHRPSDTKPELPVLVIISDRKRNVVSWNPSDDPHRNLSYFRPPPARDEGVLQKFKIAIVAKLIDLFYSGDYDVSSKFSFDPITS